MTRGEIEARQAGREAAATVRDADEQPETEERDWNGFAWPSQESWCE